MYVIILELLLTTVKYQIFQDDYFILTVEGIIYMSVILQHV